MDIRPITDSYAVSPQIHPGDAAAIRAAGFVAVICNRPDAEVPPPMQAAAMRAEAEAAGLKFFENPYDHRAFSLDLVTRQAEAMAAAGGPVLAYCASGNRCSILWALSQAGTMPADELIALPARVGYQIGQLRPQIEALASAKG